jgi:hypothetical protein
MYKREYAIVLKVRYTEDDPDVADLIYRYVHSTPYGPDTSVWHYVATMDRDNANEIVENLNFVEMEGWKEELTYLYSDAAETGLSTF